MRFSTSELVAGLGAGLELGHADTLSFIGVVIALYLVRKSSELFCLDIRVELDVQGALSVSIAPPFTGERSSSLVGAPSMARSSVSLLPASESAGPPVAAGRAGGSSEAAVVAALGGASAWIVDAVGVVRGRRRGHALCRLRFLRR